MAIHIQASHRGLLHKDLGVAKGKKLSASELEKAKGSEDPAERKRAQFAINAKKWKHSRPNGEKNARRASKLYGKKD